MRDLVRVGIGLMAVLVGSGRGVIAADLVVGSRSELVAALDAAREGDSILLRPGVYPGPFFKEGLTGITLRSLDLEDRAIIRGEETGLQLVDPTRVILQGLVFEGHSQNAINVDDGGDAGTPATGVAILDVAVRDMRPGDFSSSGIKLAGVTGFLIDRVEVRNWSAGGLGINLVGSHRGRIQHSYLRHDAPALDGVAIQVKGGSKGVTIRANRVELPREGTVRGIQAGGSTGPQHCRFVDGDSGYEADQIAIEGNVILGGESSTTFVNIDGVVLHHNYAGRPGRWFIRILNENRGRPVVRPRNGRVLDNAFVYRDAADEFLDAVNVGEETEPGTFRFSSNRWYNLADPARSTPALPVAEAGGTYGRAPGLDPDRVMDFPFEWGRWLVNASGSAKAITIDLPDRYRLARPGPRARFEPLAKEPFVGDWSSGPLPGPRITLPALSQDYLIGPGPTPAPDPD